MQVTNRFFRSVLILKCVIAFAGVGIAIAVNTVAPDSFVQIAEHGVASLLLPQGTGHWL